VEETVMTKEASTRLVTIPAVYGTESETIKVKDAALVWRTGLSLNDPPASKELLAAAKDGGAGLDAATPGMCFHEHYRPAQYETQAKSVLVSEAAEAISARPAQYRVVEKRVLVKEASSRLEEVPAVYEWVEEKVLDKPAHTIWKKGTGPIQRIDEATGEIMCLVDVPATYKSVKKRVLRQPASTRTVEIPAEYKMVKVRELIEDADSAKSEIPARYEDVAMTRKVADASFIWHEIHNLEEPRRTRTGAKVCLTEEPAQYKTVTRKVVRTPATVQEIKVPAEFTTVKVRKMIAEPREVRAKIPAEYSSVERQELVAPGQMEWRSILCETNMTHTRISEIQSALQSAGFNPGPIDGVIGKQTMAAVNAFQRARGLPVDRYLNIETLDALNVSPR
jgi:murein L,D-transpeptidase YcbB/YkuD